MKNENEIHSEETPTRTSSLGFRASCWNTAPSIRPGGGTHLVVSRQNASGRTHILSCGGFRLRAAKTGATGQRDHRTRDGAAGSAERAKRCTSAHYRRKLFGFDRQAPGG